MYLEFNIESLKSMYSDMFYDLESEGIKVCEVQAKDMNLDKVELLNKLRVSFDEIINFDTNQEVRNDHINREDCPGFTTFISYKEIKKPMIFINIDYFSEREYFNMLNRFITLIHEKQHAQDALKSKHFCLNTDKCNLLEAEIRAEYKTLEFLESIGAKDALSYCSFKLLSWSNDKDEYKMKITTGVFERVTREKINKWANFHPVFKDFFIEV